MCGIVGEFVPGGVAGERVERLRSLVNLVRHRGPDDGACWADGPFFLGHRRLSIIDLSPQGRQPMATADGALVVTFNGEIYNYREVREELRAKGHPFRTESDTEVLLHGYREWGADLPEKLVGMFAFAIADRRRQELFLARDRFGEKPLMVQETGQSVTFASELGPLAAATTTARAVDPVALADYLCLNYVPGNRTLLAGVERLAPGTWRLYGSGAPRSGVFWRPPASTQAPTLGEAVEELEVLLDRAVELSLRSDVPVGIFLSGGIDSSLVLRSAVRSGRLNRAFCLTFEEKSYSEWEKAQEAARQLGIPLTRVVLTPAALTDFLAVVEHADDPLADSSSLAVWTLAREASRHNKVVLGGDGGDELFGGYLTYKASAWHGRFVAPLPPLLRKALAGAADWLPTSERKVSGSYKLMRFLRAADLTTAEAHFTWNGTWLPARARELAREPGTRAAAAGVLARLAARHDLPPRPGLNALQRADVGDYLPNDILAKVDRMSMAHGLEVRAPMLNPALADFALSLPAEVKCTASGPTKRLLRTLAEKAYGLKIAAAGKQGFSIPVHAWLRGPGRPLVDDLLSPLSVQATGVLDPVAVGKVAADHMAGRRSYGFDLWGLMVFVAWHRTRIVQAPAPPSADAVERLRIGRPAERT